MDVKCKDFIIAKILAESGIVIAPVHTVGVISYVEKIIKSRNITAEEYCRELDTNENLLTDLINHATTNETYFFREEKQFDYLKNELFPKFKNKKLVIWSAACSTGEEPLSLLALALNFNINVEIYASDIDDNVLQFFKKGSYSKYSFRNDGKNYHRYIENLGKFNEERTLFTFYPEVIKKIKIFKYNLTDFNNFPFDTKFDIIFMRNVFIYFDYNTRQKITERVVKELNEGGHLFYSINEIGNINRKIVPDSMLKINYKQIYFYVKKDSKIITDTNIADNNNPCTPLNVFKLINEFIEKKEYEKAFEIADKFNPGYKDSFYSSFFKAYVLMKKKDFVNADKYFTTSEFMKSEFWPSYYFHGNLLETCNMPVKAKTCYRKCLEKMKRYMENESCEYDFLLKDVSSSFVYSYCAKAVKE